MAFITYPLNNIDYTAEDAELFHCTRTSGIWAEDSFPISVTGANNNVTIGTGIAWINNEEFSGKVTALKSAKVLDLGIADSTYPRIDVVAIQFNANNNATDIIIKKGTPATNPVRPSIVKTGAIYELYLASIYRPAGATAITASNVTDLRMDETVCGLMADSVTKVDMTAIKAQVKAFIDSLQNEIDSIRNLTGLMFESEWTEGGVIPVSKGGTNSTSASGARTNLGLDGKLFTQYALNSINIDNTVGNWTVDISETGHGAIPMPWVNVTQTTGAHFIVQVAIKCDTSQSASGRDQRMWIRDKYSSGVWSNWKEVLTENRGLQMVKVWQNASPTSAFAAQTVSIDLSDGDFVDIEFASGSEKFIQRYSIGATGIAQISDIYDGVNDYTSFAERIFTVNTNNIVFQGAYYKFAGAGGSVSNTLSNTWMIPQAIYLVKGVQ